MSQRIFAVPRSQTKKSPRTGLRKLCDVWGSLEAAKRVHDALELFLIHHRINYARHHGTDAYCRDYYRYMVQGRDLCAAQAVLPALRDIQGANVRGTSA